MPSCHAIAISYCNRSTLKIDTTSKRQTVATARSHSQQGIIAENR